MFAWKADLSGELDVKVRNVPQALTVNPSPIATAMG
jgi:hypothetical protein